MRTSFLLCLLALAGCGKKLAGTQTSTDHYAEYVQYAEPRFGDLSVTSTAKGDDFTITFAAPDAAWKDPRPHTMPPGSPTALLVLGHCQVTAKREKSDFAQVQPSTCDIQGSQLAIEHGSMFVHDDVLFVEVYGKLGEKSYSLVYPLGLDTDENLKMKK